MFLMTRTHIMVTVGSRVRQPGIKFQLYQLLALSAEQLHLSGLQFYHLSNGNHNHPPVQDWHGNSMRQ